MAEQVAARDSSLESLHVGVERHASGVRLVIRNQQLVLTAPLARELVEKVQGVLGEESIEVLLREVQTRVPVRLLGEWFARMQASIRPIEIQGPRFGSVESQQQLERLTRDES